MIISTITHLPYSVIFPLIPGYHILVTEIVRRIIPVKIYIKSPFRAIFLFKYITKFYKKGLKNKRKRNIIKIQNTEIR